MATKTPAVIERQLEQLNTDIKQILRRAKTMQGEADHASSASKAAVKRDAVHSLLRQAKAKVAEMKRLVRQLS